MPTRRYTARVTILVKGKVHPTTDREGPQVGGLEVKLRSFFNLGAREGGKSTPRSGRFTPEEATQYPLYRSLGWHQDWAGPMRIPSPDRPTRISPYTDWAIPAYCRCWRSYKFWIKFAGWSFIFIILYYIILYYIILYYIISYHIISYHIISYHISYHIIS